MSYESFQQHVNQLLSKLGNKKPNVRFSHEDGRHLARFSDGTMIVGNTTSLKVAVRWGSGHMAHATI